MRHGEETVPFSLGQQSSGEVQLRSTEEQGRDGGSEKLCAVATHGNIHRNVSVFTKDRESSEGENKL